MPIRIRKDKGANSNNQKKISRKSGQGGFNGGSGNGLGRILLPLLFKLFRKNPKLGILLLVLGAAGYYFLNRSGISSLDNPVVQSILQGTGLEMDEKVYDEAEVFEPLADNTKNPLPEKVTLEKYCPTRLNQGSQGSCVGWASAYAARTILESRSAGVNPNEAKFSPSFVYNQIALPNCQGTYLQKAMELMHKTGALPFSKFAYNENSCSQKPTSSEKQQAFDFKTKGFNRLSKNGNNYETDLLAIKQNLSQGAPVVIGMMVGGSFMSNMKGKNLWKPNQKDYQMRGFGGHAMCVIGYDDYYEGGAFQLMNSWGNGWGKNGIAWVKYNDFAHFNKEAYGLYPMGNAEKVDRNKLNIEIGLVLNRTGKSIPLNYLNKINFITAAPIKIDDDFKIEISNSIECYVYIFGKETDGSNYVLFPYTKKHSPYCGITGTRLFPKDYSLYPDKEGTKDFIAIVISKQALNYNELNNAINNSKETNYEDKIYTTLNDELVDNITFKSGNTIKIETNSPNKNTIALASHPPFF